MKVKTIDIQAKEWFDKINGNSYWSAEVVINYQMPNQETYIFPFRYGYGNSYEYTTIESMRAIYPDLPKRCDFRESGIIVRSNIKTGCKKRELYNPTQKEIETARKNGTHLYPFYKL